MHDNIIKHLGGWEGYSIQGNRILSVSIMWFFYYIPKGIGPKVYWRAICPVRWISKSHRQKTKEIYFLPK